MTAHRTAPPARALDVGTLLRYAAAATTAGAAFIHFAAVGAHQAHPHIAAFFVVLAGAQLAWAAAAAWRPTPLLLIAGAAGNLAVATLWLVSRTSGVPLVPDVGEAEAAGVPDVLATFLELGAVAAVGLLRALPEQARAALLPSPDRAVAGLLAGVLLLTLPGSVAGQEEHGGGDAHLAGHVGGPLGSGHGDSHGDPENSAHGDAGHAGPDRATADHADHHPVDGGGEVLRASHRHVESSGVAGGDSGLAAGGHDHHAALDGTVGTAASGGAGAHDHHGGAASGGHEERAWPEGALNAEVRYGPFSLPPASTDGPRGHHPVLSNVVMTQLTPPCEDCYLVAMEPRLVYEDGSPANFDTGAMLHHNVLFDATRDDLTCPRSSEIGFLGLRFFASGNERTRGVLPPGFGYHVEEDAWWNGIFEIMNMTEQPQTVYFSFRVAYAPANAGGVEPVTPVWLDVDNCEDSEYAVPAGPTATTWDWESSLTGRVVFAGGHVHDGGVMIEVSNGTTGDHLCDSVAGYGNDPAYMGAIDTMTTCSWDRLGTVREGELLRIVTHYHSTEPQDDVMGIVVAFIHETTDLGGGTKAPESVRRADVDDGPREPHAHAGH